MRERIFYSAGSSAALPYATQNLKNAGCSFSMIPCSEVTDLLLPVPSLDPNGNVNGSHTLQDILKQLPDGISIYGGNLPTMPGYQVWDLLKDPAYVAENAYITAHCAVRLALDKLPIVLRNCKTLVIGWGRIGKCLAKLLKGLEADVTVAARKESDRAILSALGYNAISTEALSGNEYRVIFNTVPLMILPDVPAECLSIDLASVPGMAGNTVIYARGLPGKDAPESSGSLIARTVLRLMNKGE